MKQSVQMKVGPFTIVTVEGEDIKEVHKGLAKLAEIYSEKTCGRCGKESVIPVHRISGKYQYFELKCTEAKCGARLALGQAGDGGLYPNRRIGPDGMPVKFDDPTGKYDGQYKGWHFFRPEGEAPPAQAPVTAVAAETPPATTRRRS